MTENIKPCAECSKSDDEMYNDYIKRALVANINSMASIIVNPTTIRCPNCRRLVTMHYEKLDVEFKSYDPLQRDI